MLVCLPAEKFHKDARDFAAQLQEHHGWILYQQVVQATPSPFEAYLTNRILSERGDRWIDRLELNVASRACEVLGLRIAKGPDAALAGHSEPDWMNYGALGYDILKDGPYALSDCLIAMARVDGVDGRFFGRLFGPWMAWLKSRSLGDEFELLRDVVRRHVFDNFSVRKGVLVLGVPSEGMASSNPQKSVSLKGFAKRNAEDLIYRGLATREASGDIVPMSFVTQRMLDAYEREQKSFRNAKRSSEGGKSRTFVSDETNAAGQSRLSIGDAAGQLRVTVKTVGYLIQHGMLCGVDASEQYRRGATVVTIDSLARFQESFISLGEFSELVQRPQGALSMKLRNANVALLAMPHDLSRIYWREDVSAYATTKI